MIAEPVFKWPGSKRWLANLARALGKTTSGRIVEPFAGSAAFFIHSESQSGVLGDVNEELVNCLIGLRDYPQEIIYRLQSLKNDKTHFEKIKSLRLASPVDRAARFIFLLNTCWGGIYRENLHGEFNVPFGNNGREFLHKDRIFATSERLQFAEIRHQSYRDTLEQATIDDLVILDPPYVVPEVQHFDRYHRNKFTWDDQISLSKRFMSRDSRTALVIMAAAESKALFSLFDDWGVVRFQRRASLTAASGYTGVRAEALLFSPALVEALDIGRVRLDEFVAAALCTPRSGVRSRPNAPTSPEVRAWI